MSQQVPREISVWEPDNSVELLETSMGDLLRRTAEEVPDRVALVDAVPEASERRTWTYRELLEESEAVARALLARFQPGERVALWGPNSAEWMIFQQGASLAGIVLVTVNPAYRHKEVEFVLRQGRVAGVALPDEYRGFDMVEAVADLRDRLPELREVIKLSEWSEFVVSGDPATALPDVGPSDPVQIQYTSGTTGFPKGALLHHRGIVNASRGVGSRINARDGVVWVNAMPMFHIGGSGVTELATLSHRGTYVLMPAFDPGLLLELVETYRGEITLVVPAMLNALLAHPDMKARDLSSLQTVLSGAAVVPADLVRRTKEAFGCDLSIMFGQTEMHGVISQTLPTDSPEDQEHTIGRPLPRVEVKIADPETGEPLPVNTSGEICARGFMTMLEYFDLPDETAATLGDDGWLRSGDLGAMDERGYLSITGRLKDAIIRGGENIYPREMEDLLVSHPQVAQVAVIGLPDQQWGERVTAVVLPAGLENPPTIDELHTYCREHLANYKTPREWFIVDEFPVTATGKIQKYRLVELAKAGELGTSVRTDQPAASS